MDDAQFGASSQTARPRVSLRPCAETTASAGYTSTIRVPGHAGGKAWTTEAAAVSRHREGGLRDSFMRHGRVAIRTTGGKNTWRAGKKITWRTLTKEFSYAVVTCLAVVVPFKELLELHGSPEKIPLNPFLFSKEPLLGNPQRGHGVRMPEDKLTQSLECAPQVADETDAILANITIRGNPESSEHVHEGAPGEGDQNQAPSLALVRALQYLAQDRHAWRMLHEEDEIVKMQPNEFMKLGRSSGSPTASNAKLPLPL
ncbi:hypothetical protein C8A03DRAFT_32681 [Achaetomium macrosporum]|uniref:Uncharacterized protein n=1 Tax=Achaetomium macrosporum TaxID=79813 RepID=A0AAN7HG94_9PEZI|nr:hypothetical protein C8A03DRAFT_32681 [Achaetomium macrosporum]